MYIKERESSRKQNRSLKILSKAVSVKCEQKETPKLAREINRVQLQNKFLQNNSFNNFLTGTLDLSQSGNSTTIQDQGQTFVWANARFEMIWKVSYLKN